MLSVRDDLSFTKPNFGRGQQLYHFVADFFETTPRPKAQMSFVFLWACCVVAINRAQLWGSLRLELDQNAGRILTVMLAFLIVFRTNQSYNRWWEGRILWGKMHR